MGDGGSPVSWTANLKRTGGFFTHSDWYDLQLDRRLPLAPRMREELLFALPPLSRGQRVCDLLCGSGLFTSMLLSAYPDITVVLVDESHERLGRAQARILDRNPHAKIEVIRAKINTSDACLPGGPYDAVVNTLCMHVLVGHDTRATAATTGYSALFSQILASLKPGGHLIFGDHVGTLPLFPTLMAMRSSGFSDVDVGWREKAFFVAGGTKPSGAPPRSAL